MAEVKLKDVTKVFGKVVAVKNFNLDIADGEFIILVGPSGCGKTTTLRSIAGLEEINSGEIYIGDRLVNDVPPKADLLGIGELLDRKPKELSGGQRQRVALGRAIVRNPKVFLFDEPLSNLDAKLRIAMRAELLDLHRRLKTTTIYVTHDQLEAMTMGDRIVVMNEGVIQQVGTPQEVYDHPKNKYVAGFIGSPEMNFVPCKLVMKNGDMYAVDKSFALRIPPEHAKQAKDYVNKEVILGIRPEHLATKEMAKDYDPQAVFNAYVWVVEPLGSELLVHVRNERHTLVARLDPYAKVKVGETTELIAFMERAHIFDKETEETIF